MSRNYLILRLLFYSVTVAYRAKDESEFDAYKKLGKGATYYVGLMKILNSTP